MGVTHVVQDVRAVAIILVLAALAYLLYLWSKRKDQIPCPSCGARVNIYADECPHCGHKKGESVKGEEAADSIGSAIGGGDQPSGPEREPQRPQEPEEPESPEPAPEPVSAEAADVDYEEVVQGTVAEVKHQVMEEDLDPEQVLEAEKNGKDRVTLIDWLEEQLAQQ